MSGTISLSPIAVVRSQFNTNTPAEEMRVKRSQLVIRPEFEPGLSGLEADTDILVVFYFHRIERDEIELVLQVNGKVRRIILIKFFKFG